MFFKILSMSNTGDSAAYILATIHFLYPKLGSFSDMDYYFYQLAYRDSKVPKHFVGLIQMQCSPSFDCNWDKQNDPTTCWHQLHPRYRVLQQGKFLSYPPECVGGVTETINFFIHFHGLIPDTNYKHLECFVRIGTHSELHRGQMLHICDISPLRVK